MPTPKEEISAILVEQSYVSAEDMAKALSYSQKTHTDILDYLFDENLLTEDLLGQAMAEFFKVPYTNLHVHELHKDQVKRIPQDIAKEYGVVFLGENDQEVSVVTYNPAKKNLMAALKEVFKGGKTIKITYGLVDEIEASFIHYRETLQTRFSKIIQTERSMAAPQILEEVLKDALSFNTSDIHFEPQEASVLVRFRVDGMLQGAGELPKDTYDNLVNHIKVKARLQTDDHFSAQDGAMHYLDEDRKIDLRISIAPVMDGEKVVIRLLSPHSRHMTFNDLGLLTEDQRLLKNVAKKPFGMVMVVGPTGSGKTTTLYGILKMLNRPDINIATIEDPVEYKIQGVNHIQVNSATNLTFVRGIRSLVRQDPDVILVGEIRDRETAEIAVNAALTGHLLFSTFHANDASTAVPRLLDMGIEPFLLSSSLELIISQRLCRRICSNCLHSITFTQNDLKRHVVNADYYFSEEEVILYRGKGCSSCNQTGYKGRIAIFEIIRVTQEMKYLFIKNPSSQAIWKLARSQGARSMFEDGLEKVRSGLTTLEELTRIASPLP